MPRARVKFVCRECGAAQPAYLGRCPVCQAWASLDEEVEAPPPSRSEPRAGSMRLGTAPERLSHVESASRDRVSVGSGEFDRVLGGGLVRGSVTLFAGDPGIGKSTLLLQAAGSMPESVWPVLYVAAEESPPQVRLRADRLGVPQDHILVLAENDVDAILEQAEQARPGLLIVDSIQTVAANEVASSAGSVTQVRETAARLSRWAKTTNTPLFLVGHVTKEGQAAGPRVLEHMVDVVLYLEGDRHHHYRVLRGAKNRFGSTNEVGIFEMVERGLQEVSNPSAAFLEERRPDMAGSVVVVTMEGTRPILVEVQALTAPTAYGPPRRMATGIDLSRLYLLTAVLSQRVGLALGQHDVYVNVVGGLRVAEPAADLAVALAIASSLHGRPIEAGTAVVGEVGLAGELRSVSQLEARLREAQALGFERMIVPDAGRRPSVPAGLQVRRVSTLAAVVAGLVPATGRGGQRRASALPLLPTVPESPMEEEDDER